MSDEKRPHPIINMKPERVEEPRSRPSGAQAGSLPPPGGSRSWKDGPGPKPAGGAPKPPQRDAGKPSFIGRAGGYAAAGLIGGICATAILLALPAALPQLGVVMSGDVQGEVRQLQDKTVALERAIAAQSAARKDDGDDATAEAVAQLGGRMDTLVRRVSGMEAELVELSQRLADVEKSASAPADSAQAQAQAERAVAPLQARLTSLEREIANIDKVLAERQGQAKNAALAIAFANLKRAVEAGRPFAAELASVEQLSQRKLPLNALALYKDEGVPTLAALTGDFADASKRAIERHYQGSSSGFVGEMLARARSAIQITASDQAGSGPEAVIGRMQAAVRSGDLARAVQEGASLTGRAAEEMQPWLQAAQSRMAADEALGQTDAELMAALTKSGARR